MDISPNQGSKCRIEFILDFIKKFNKTELRTAFTIEIGDNMPMIVSTSIANNSTAEFMMAPRVRTD